MKLNSYGGMRPGAGASGFLFEGGNYFEWGRVLLFTYMI